MIERAARIEGVVLAAVALGALIFQLWLPSTHVAESDYQAVASVLSAEQQPGDVVLLVPWWTERARIYVPEGLPVVGYQGSDADSLERHPRIWVLSEPSLPRAGIGAFEKAFLPSRKELGSARSFGNLKLQLFENGRSKPLVLDAAELVAQANVYLEGPDGSRQDCPWNGGGHRCSNGKTVSKEWRDVHWAPWPCVKMEAPGGANRVVMEFTTPAAASSSLSAGYIWEYGSCKEGCTPSTVWFEVNGQAQSMELQTGDELMHRLEGPPLAEGSRVRIALLSQNPNARVVCFVMNAWGTR
ncbi:MAG: hypothetical protein JNM17_04410 [Archangium sp.]|nr:hypothetical protein [Archangium sp.]